MYINKTLIHQQHNKWTNHMTNVLKITKIKKQKFVENHENHENFENVIDVEKFKHFKNYENIVNFIYTNREKTFKLTQIAQIVDIDAKKIRQKFRKIYAMYDINTLPTIVECDNNNEKWRFEFNENNLLKIIEMCLIQNIKIQMKNIV